MCKWRKKLQQFLYVTNAAMNLQNGLESVRLVGQWNTFFEEKLVGSGTSSKDKNKPKSEVIKLNEVEKKTSVRIKTGVQELDRVLGGRICEGLTNTSSVGNPELENQL